MKKQLQLILMLLIMPLGMVLAQQPLQIMGKVTNTEGEPVQGVSISIKGRLNAITATDDAGAYSLQAEKSDVLIFKGIGFKTVERTIANHYRTILNFFTNRSTNASVDAMQHLTTCRLVPVCAMPVMSSAQAQAGKTLDIYYIDTEGGQATLFQ